MIAKNEMMETFQSVSLVALECGTTIQAMLQCVLLGALSCIEQQLVAINDTLRDLAPPLEGGPARDGEDLEALIAHTAHRDQVLDDVRLKLRDLQRAIDAHEIKIETHADALQSALGALAEQAREIVKLRHATGLDLPEDPEAFG